MFALASAKAVLGVKSRKALFYLKTHFESL